MPITDMKALEGVRMRKAVAVTCAATALAVLVGCGTGSAGRDGGFDTGRLDARTLLNLSALRICSLRSYALSGLTEVKAAGGVTVRATSLAEYGRGKDGRLAVHLSSESNGVPQESYIIGNLEYARRGGGEWMLLERGGEPGGDALAAERRLMSHVGDLAVNLTLDRAPGAFTFRFELPRGPDDARGDAVENADGRQVFTLAVDSRNLLMKSVRIESEGGTGPGSWSYVFSGKYHRYNRPVKVEPPPEAFSATAP